MVTCSYLCLIFDSHLSFSSAIISPPSLLCVSTTSVIFALFLTMIQLAPPAHLLFTADLAAAIPCTIVRSQIAFYTSRMFISSPTISQLQSQDHILLLPVCRTSLVEQASSYSSCSLSCWSFIITQLFSIIMPTSWTTCQPFSW